MEVLNNSIITDSDKVVSFRTKIKKTIVFDNFVIVLLDKEIDSDFNENVYCVDLEESTIKWQVEKYQYSYKSSSFVDIFRVSDKTVRLFNWDGTKLEVNVISGKVITDCNSLRENKRPW